MSSSESGAERRRNDESEMKHSSAHQTSDDRSRSRSRESQHRRTDSGEPRGRSFAESDSVASTPPAQRARRAAFEADAAWASQDSVAVVGASQTLSPRRRADDKRKRHQFESDDDDDDDDDDASSSASPIAHASPSRNASAAPAAAAAVVNSAAAPVAAPSPSPSSSPSSITALLPRDSGESPSDAFHDPSIFGCRKVSCYTRLNTIDEGTYGVVHRAVDARTGEQVALKKIKLDSQICASGFPITSLREINILLSLRHPNIVELKEIVTAGGGRRAPPKGIYMVMEYAEHDLKALLNRMGAVIHPESGHIAPAAFQPFRIPEIKCLLKQLLEGMAYLHENWTLHRDLKTSNLLYNSQGRLKICDFGLARRYGDPLGSYTPLVVTLWYRSPELLFGAKKYSSSVDMWSVGCIWAELLLTKPLFAGQTELDQISRILKVLGTPDVDSWPGFAELDYAKTYSFTKVMPSRLRESFPVHSYIGGNVLSDTGFDLMRRLLCYNPEERITAADALKHPYFQEAPLPQPIELMPTFPASNEKMHQEHSGPSSADLKRNRERETTGFFL